MGEQLFPVDPGPESENLSADRRRTIRNNDLIARGIHPATGRTIAEGEDEMCGTCAHAVRVGHNSRSYWKCSLAGVTRGAGTDIRVSWPACVSWKELGPT